MALYENQESKRYQTPKESMENSLASTPSIHENFSLDGNSFSKISQKAALWAANIEHFLKYIYNTSNDFRIINNKHNNINFNYNYNEFDNDFIWTSR